ncbi:SPOR domain-containing protein [Salinicola aestuarinus]|uniref:SPOR domain-containing protein n=1 Tax=Salinicola aestuarinus TaxID=1949082 RepID=UPI000DA10F28|nr:SPOR domain-containing protein [Salinicola aestuarinus]
MKYGWRERIIGAVILVALGALFLPMLFDEPAPREQEPEPVMVIEQPVDGGEARQRIIESPQPPASVATGQSGQPNTAVPEPDTSGQLSGGNGGFGQSSDGDDVASDDGQSGSSATQPRTDPIAEIAESETSSSAPAESAPAASEDSAPAESGSRTPATPDGGWVVQVGSFGQAGNAERLTADLKSQGFPAYSQPRDNDLTTVYVGPYGSSDAGESARGELKQAANIQGLLIRNPGN